MIHEKESKIALHASGRNSGVLHAGFYYSSNSLKAKLTADGNRAMRKYCLERKLPINQCGKLVVAQTKQDLLSFGRFLKRGKANGVELHKISEAEAKEIEPKVKTCDFALWSPTTATVDPKKVMESLYEDAVRKDLEIHFNSAFSSENASGYIINTAGLYADKIAKQFGFSKNYEILPFKGYYLYLKKKLGLKTNIYPVPDISYPFLGVHYTVTAEGMTKLGPTAVPALWRENYKGFDNFRLDELGSIAKLQAVLFARNDMQFRRIAFEETQKMFKSKMVSLAQSLTNLDISVEDFSWGRSGIRAQLFDYKQKKLVDDFITEGDNKSFHVLNAVSPAFTCSIPFAKLCVDRIDALCSHNK